MKIVTFPPGAILHAERDTIDVTSLGGSSIPDPNWSFTDPAGHVHTHASETFGWVYEDEEFYFDADGEEYNGDGHYECTACGAEVPPPGTKISAPAGVREYMAGLVNYRIELADGTTQRLTEKEANAYYAALRAEQEREELDRPWWRPATRVA